MTNGWIDKAVESRKQAPAVVLDEAAKARLKLGTKVVVHKESLAIRGRNALYPGKT